MKISSFRYGIVGILLMLLIPVGCKVPLQFLPAKPVAGIRVSPDGPLVVSENGGTAYFEVVLSSPPFDWVTIQLGCSEHGEIQLNPDTVNFDTTNWFIPQTISVIGLDDASQDGDRTVYVVLEPCDSPDSAYQGLDGEDLEVICVDDEVPGVLVTAGAGLTTTEMSGSGTFQIMLRTSPVADVQLNLKTSDSSEGNVSPAILTFGTGNWNVPREITVIGQDDVAMDGTMAYVVTVDSSSAVDPEYDGLTLDDIPVVNLDNDMRITAGSRYSSWIKPDGSLWTWGLSIGLADMPSRCYPTASNTGGNWCLVQSAIAHSVGLKTNGSLWTWGANTYGQLGDGTTGYIYSPTQMGSDTDWAYADAGGGGSQSGHTVALKNDGTLWSWGSGKDGQLGTGYLWSQTTPLQVGSDSDWIAVSAGMNHTMAIKRD
ncbi:MAG: hypothetical protein KAJ98_12000, partial [Spirochaetaceae bacterium]|nr:hypothetical protein [Spirochaetaceae bacterium]